MTKINRFFEKPVCKETEGQHFEPGGISFKVLLLVLKKESKSLHTMTANFGYLSMAESAAYAYLHQTGFKKNRFAHQ
jgi:hypothetical protein